MDEKQFKKKYKVVLNCQKCGWEWLNRKYPGYPRTCPGCKNPKYWEKRKR